MKRDPITTNQVEAPRPQARPRNPITTKIIPYAKPRPERKPYEFGEVISTNNIEEIQAKRKAEEKAGKGKIKRG